MTELTEHVHEKRFEELVRANHRAVRTYALSMASTPSLAEDAVQETFLKAWRHLDKFRGEGSFEGWLIRICRRCVLDLEAKERRVAELVDRTTRLANVSHITPPDHGSEMLTLVEALPAAQREVVVVCGLLGYDYETAATILDVPVGTVRSRLHRARKRIEDELGISARHAG